MAQPDPTSPLIGGSIAESTTIKNNDIVLQSIIKSTTKDQLTAVVSGQLVKLGDTVFGYEITQIDGRSITLKSVDSARKLTLFTQPIVKYK